jgi:hypothetical protein
LIIFQSGVASCNVYPVVVSALIHLLVRALLASLSAGFVVWLLLAMDARLDVSFQISAETGGHRTELFWAMGEQGFHPARSQRWLPPDGATRDYHWRYADAQRVSAVRIDPIADTGAGVFAAITLQGRGGRVTLSGPSLLAQIVDSKDLSFEVLDAQRLAWRAHGDDPQIVLPVPPQVHQPLLTLLQPWPVLAGVLAGLLWVLLEVVRGAVGARRAMGAVLLLGLVLGLTALAQTRIVNAHFTGDAVENLRIANNVVVHRVYSHLDGQPPRPTNQREPLPTLVLAGWILAVDRFAPRLRDDADYPAVVRQVNLGWVLLGLLGVVLLTRSLTRSDLAAGVAAMVAFVLFLGRPQVVNALYTELPAAALLTWLCLLAVLALRRPGGGMLLLLGVAMGLLALTKNAAHYVALVAIPVFALLLYARAGEAGAAARLRGTGRRALVLALGFALTVAPWMLRNALVLETAELSGRAGVLYGRALMNGMTLEEVYGSIYIDGPQLYHRLVAGTRLAAQPEDLLAGGRWQRLNRGASDFVLNDIVAARDGRPEDAISFHRQVAATHARERERLTAQGVQHVEVELERWFRSEGLRLIREQPGRHALMTLPAAWRGFWGFPYGELPLLSPGRAALVIDLINLAGGLALGGLALAGLLARRPEWLALTLVPVGLLAFYALFTHNIPRYMMPVIPLMLVSLVSLPWLLRRGRAPD